MADYPKGSKALTLSSKGKINLFVTHKNPNEMKVFGDKPDMTTKSPMVNSMAPILKTISEVYSPIRSKLNLKCWLELIIG